jgi:uncharacterized phosphosugar-binding protein
MMIEQYFSKIHDQLKLTLEREKENMHKAAEKVASTIMNGGIIHLFGCGHSHILTEEVFYRAGGLVPLRPILHEPLMLHEGASRSSEIERKNDYAETFMKDQDIQPRDLCIVLSTSGRNPVPVDVTLIAKEKGVEVIGVTSYEYSSSSSSRHTSGKHLYDVVDLVIDNHSVKGDAILTHPDVTVPFTPTSTVLGATILNSIFSEAIVIMAEANFEPPIFLSGNLEGTDEHNQQLIERYKDRIPFLI